MKKRLKTTIIFLIFLISLMTIFSCYNCVLKGVSSGMNLCVLVIIPSLFPMLCLTSFLALSGILEVFAAKLDRISRKYFNLSGYFIPVFLISIISGYPVGAAVANSLFEKKCISVSERNKIASVSCSAGPAFVLLAVGINIFNSFKIGEVLLFSNLLACIITALVATKFYKKTDEKANFHASSPAISDCAVFAVSNATSSVISICAFTIIFSAIVNVLTIFCKNKTAFLITVGILEVTNGVFELANAKIALPFVCSIIGFGGISVIFQISALLKTARPPIFKIITIRAFCAVLSFVFCYISCKIFNITTPVLKSFIISLKTTSQNYYFSAALLLLAVVFLAFLQNQRIKSK